MRKLGRISKRMMAVIMTAFVAAASLMGCQSDIVDNYLEDLGMIDPDNKVDQTLTGENDNVSYENEQESAQASATAVTVNPDGDKDSFPSLGDNEAAADEQFSSTYTETSGAETDKDVQKAREEAGLTEDGIEALKKQQEGLYAYERLTDAGKTLYVEMLAVLQNLASDVTVSTTSDEAIELVYDYVMADHPEIFYVDGYQYTNYSVGDTITRVSFTGNYLYGEDEVARRKTQINEAVNKCLAGAPSTDDDYLTIKYVYEYLIAHTDYDMEVEDNQNICSVFIDGRSVCNGYAKAAQYLLGKLGVPCTLVVGTVDTKNSTGVRHAWNLVLCNNAYYYLDVTWGDASYQTVSGETADAAKLPDVNYDYLNVTTEEISKNHEIFDTIAMPLCSSMSDNYYVRENEYFTNAELSLIGDLFDRRYKDGSENVTIKCASDDVYDELFEALITNRKVFDYLQGDTSQVSYTTFQDTRTIIFWI